MIRTIDHNKMGKSERGWLHSTFHFSFAEYYNPDNMQFGVLRVVNDDVFDTGNGFGTHSHQDMDISVVSLEAGNNISYALHSDRQAYLIQVEGNGTVNGMTLTERDAAEITDEADIILHATEKSHYILFDMMKA